MCELWCVGLGRLFEFQSRQRKWNWPQPGLTPKLKLIGADRVRLKLGSGMGFIGLFFFHCIASSESSGLIFFRPRTFWSAIFFWAQNFFLRIMLCTPKTRWPKPDTSPDLSQPDQVEPLGLGFFEQSYVVFCVLINWVLLILDFRLLSLFFLWRFAFCAFESFILVFSIFFFIVTIVFLHHKWGFWIKFGGTFLFHEKKKKQISQNPKNYPSKPLKN